MLDRERAHVIDSQLGPYDAISGHMRCGYRRTTAIGIAKCVRRFEASFNGSRRMVLDGQTSTLEGGADRDRKIADRSQRKGAKLEVPGEGINPHT
jgi:hypothetical protein